MGDEENLIIDEYRDYEVQVRGRSANSVEMYIRIIRSFGDWIATRGDTFFSTSEEDIEAWLKHLFTARGNLRNSTRASKLSAVKSFYNHLVKRGFLSGNPAARIPSPKFRSKSPRIFTTEELALIFDGPDVSTEAGIRDLAALSLMYGAGPRVAELAGIDMEDLTFTAETCTVLFHGKGAKERSLKLLRTPTAAVQSWYAVRIAEGAAPGDPFLTTLTRDAERRGLRMSSAALNEVLKKYAVRVGLHDPDVFMHKMRATFATDLYNARPDPYLVAAKMGHEDIKTTMRYVVVSEAALNQGVIPEKRWRQVRRGGPSAITKG